MSKKDKDKLLSECHGAEVKTDGIPDFIGGDEIVTVSYICSKCGEPCNIKETKDKERKIHCCECSKYLGLIRNAKIRKEMEFVCKECREKWKALKTYADLKRARESFAGSDFEDIMGGLFRNPKK